MSKEMQVSRNGQEETGEVPERPSVAKLALDFAVALVLAVVSAVLVDLWLHPAVAARPCEAAVHFALPGAPPRCPAPPADTPA